MSCRSKESRIRTGPQMTLNMLLNRGLQSNPKRRWMSLQELLNPGQRDTASPIRTSIEPIGKSIEPIRPTESDDSTDLCVTPFEIFDPIFNDDPSSNQIPEFDPSRPNITMIAPSLVSDLFDPMMFDPTSGISDLLLSHNDSFQWIFHV